MPRKRIIDPEFWSDEEIGHWSHSARLFYIGLWNFADDEGRFKAHSGLLKGQIFPYDVKINIDRLKKELGNKIHWYSINGSAYGEVVNFHKHQRIDKPQASKIPSPSGSITSPPLTKEIIDKITERDKSKCQYCGKKIDDVIIDHIIPWARGGRHYPENLTVACRSCNSIKRDRLLTEMPEEFIVNLYNKELYIYSEKNSEASKLNPPNISKENISKDNILSGKKPDIESPIEYLNQKTKSHYDPKNKSNQDLVRARYNEGRTLDDFKRVIDTKVSQWLNNEKMMKYLRPSTLFNRTNFENYLNEPRKAIREEPKPEPLPSPKEQTKVIEMIHKTAQEMGKKK